MSRLLGLFMVLGLAACGAETGTNDDACREADAVINQINDLAASDELTPEQKDLARQWEFRLAEAAVLATDHDLSVAIRTLADVAGNVAEDPASTPARQKLDEAYENVARQCD
ncbi:hypothetical protein [Flaviflexus equikiangi]|uniref:Lipoprotein n=1 Tax=Flaviflexus equikiangi TaxID=2758573 RepID=A0ABS2TEL2_9ACTO|nr:hypothetical protein [Flaviflexus equikiangi]MBM9433090.1 hypothetical protein [Flaviflexus equikiangi]